MRSILALGLLTLANRAATACPPSRGAAAVATDEGPTTQVSCLREVDFQLSTSVFEIHHTVGAGGTVRSGLGNVGTAFVGLDVLWGRWFGGDPVEPGYEVELGGGARLHRTGGAVTSNAVTTRAGLRLGPARLAARVRDEGRANFAFFPMTMELAHAGELAGRPRMSARPELARSLFARERVEAASRFLRIQGAGTRARGPLDDTQPSSFALDVFPVHAGIDVATQQATRIDARFGGALFGVVEHARGVQLDALAIEHRTIDVPMTEAIGLSTLWLLRLDGVDANTGTQYRMGWGQVIAMDARQEALANLVDPVNGNLTIGGAGWYAKRAWGGWGAQYKREPYISMQGDLGLEDRIAAEVYVPRAAGLVTRVFAARTTTVVNDELDRELTAGIEMSVSYTRRSWTARIGVEVGRTYYAALDSTLPTHAGLGAALDLTVHHAATHTWR